MELSLVARITNQLARFPVFPDFLPFLTETADSNPHNTHLLDRWLR